MKVEVKIVRSDYMFDERNAARGVIMFEKIKEFMISYPEIKDKEIGCTNCGNANHIDTGDLNQFGTCRCKECNSPLI